MSPPPGSDGRHQQHQERMVSSMESGGVESGTATRRFNWKGPAIVLVFELLESIAFSGLALNLVVYLATVLHGSTAFNAAHVDTWNGTTFIVPVIGAFLADSYCGKYWTILASIAFYLLGLVLLTVSAAVPSLRPATTCEMGMSCAPATKTQFAVFFAALYLTSIGTGGVKSALLPFGAEQYDDDTERPERKQSFFSWFFAAINLGIFIAGTLISWLQQNVAWALGFGIGTACLAIAAAVFVAGTPWYRVQVPAGSPLKDILRVIVAAFRKRRVRLAGEDAAVVRLHEQEADKEDGQQRLARTKGLRCLDKAAAIVDDGKKAGPWDLCTVSEVEGVKILVRMLPIWATCVMYAASLGQMTTTFIQQGDDHGHPRPRLQVARGVAGVGGGGVHAAVGGAARRGRHPAGPARDWTAGRSDAAAKHGRGPVPGGPGPGHGGAGGAPAAARRPRRRGADERRVAGAAVRAGGRVRPVLRHRAAGVLLRRGPHCDAKHLLGLLLPGAVAGVLRELAGGDAGGRRDGDARVARSGPQRRTPGLLLLALDGHQRRQPAALHAARLAVHAQAGGHRPARELSSGSSSGTEAGTVAS